MRVLYFVPMVHTQEELGSLKEAVTKALEEKYREKYREEQTEGFFKQIERYWEEVDKIVQQTELCQPELASRLHIFVDSLPNVDETIVNKIVGELIDLDIPVYRIIKKLQANGAKIHGTEDAELLVEEHKYWHGISIGKKADATFAQQLLEKRDMAIARRIDNVMQDEEVGILFIGRAHNVIGELAKLFRKFKIIYL